MRNPIRLGQKKKGQTQEDGGSASWGRNYKELEKTEKFKARGRGDAGEVKTMWVRLGDKEVDPQLVRNVKTWKRRQSPS